MTHDTKQPPMCLWLVALVLLAGCRHHSAGHWESHPDPVVGSVTSYILDTGEICGVIQGNFYGTASAFVHGDAVGDYTTISKAKIAIEKECR